MRPEWLGLGTFAFLLAGLVAVSPLILGRSSLQLAGTPLIAGALPSRTAGASGFQAVNQALALDGTATAQGVPS
jgi:hypothetical protein